MWCEHCRQDVAAVVTEQQISCHRCQLPLPRRASSVAPSAAIAADADPQERPIQASSATADWADRPWFTESWEMDEELRHFGRLLKVDAPSRVTPASHDNSFESLNPTATEHLSLEAIYGQASRKKSLPAPQRSRFGWLVGGLGLMAATCGVVLLALAHFGQRPDLYAIGTPCAIAGATGLMLLAVVGCLSRRAKAAASLPNDEAPIRGAAKALPIDIQDDWMRQPPQVRPGSRLAKQSEPQPL